MLGKKMLGNDIDVDAYELEKGFLIKELNELWTISVDAYDSFKQQTFKLHATLMWAICDFPRLGNLSSWNTYIILACPSCNFDFVPTYLNGSQKPFFWGFSLFS